MTNTEYLRKRLLSAVLKVKNIVPVKKVKSTTRILKVVRRDEL